MLIFNYFKERYFFFFLTLRLYKLSTYYMCNTKQITHFFTILLCGAFGYLATAQNNLQTTNVLYITDSSDFYAEEGAILTVKNGFTIVQNNTESVVLSVCNSTPPFFQQLALNELKGYKISLKKDKIVAKATTKTQKTENTSTYQLTALPLGGFPYGSNLSSLGNNAIGILVPTTTNQKHTKPNTLVGHYSFPIVTISQEYITAPICTTHYVQGASSFLTKSNLFSRPPPSPLTPHERKRTGKAKGELQA